MTVRGGFALPAVLLVLLAATGLAHVAHYVARQELAVATAERRMLGGRLSAESALRTTEDALDTLVLRVSRGDSVVLTGSTGPRDRFRVVARRLDRETRWVVAEGEWSGSAWRAGRVAWVLDAPARLVAMGATLATGRGTTATPGTTVDGTVVARDPLAWGATECSAFRAVVDSIFPAGSVAPVGTWTSPWATADGARTGRLGAGYLDRSALGLGLLTLSDLEAVADRRLPGSASAGVALDMGSGCPASGGGWGTPLDPGGPCGGYFGVVTARNDVDITGGQGQGVLVVDGDVEISGNAVFAGVVLSSGNLRLSEDAHVAGWIRAAGAARLEDRAKLDGSACSGLRALGSPALGSARAHPAGSWLWPL